MVSEPRSRSPQAVTRQQLLEIGAEMVFESPPAGFNIRIKDVVDRAGKTTGAAYQIWSSQQQYQQDLAEHVARSLSYATAEDIESRAQKLIENGEGIERVVEECGAAYLAQLVAGPKFYASLHFWTAFNQLSPTVKSAVAETYGAIQAQFELFFDAIFAVFNLVLVPPNSLASVTTAATSLTEGAALRLRFCTSAEEERAVRDSYCLALLALQSATTKPRT